MGDRLKGAIIGCGRVVLDHHIPAWQQLGREGVAEWVLADPNGAGRLPAQMALGVPNEHAYADYRALLLRERPDFVVVCTPHVSHERIVLDCIRAGVPVLVEKPICDTVEAAEHMVHAADVAGVPLAVIHNYRYMEQTQKARKLLTEGAIGRPYLYRSEWIGMGWSEGINGYDPDWRTNAGLAGGGCLLDNGCHNIYMAREFLGPVQTVTARVGTFTNSIKVEDTALVLLGHADGGTSSIQVAWSASGQSQHVNEVYGTEGTLRLESDGDVSISRGEEWERHEVRADSGFLNTFRQFLDALHGHGVLPTTGKEALETVRAIRAAYASSRCGVSVKTQGFSDSGN